MSVQRTPAIMAATILFLALSMGVPAAAAAASNITLPVTDIFWRNTTTGAVSLWTMYGTTQANSIDVDTAPLSWQVAGIGDLNSDRDPDLLWRNVDDGSVAVWTTDGMRITGFSYVNTAPLSWKIAGVGDFNGDGKRDIVWQNIDTGEVALWLMDGLAHAGFVPVGSASLEWSVAGIGDFNGDGNPDILWQNTATGMVAVWEMAGTAQTGLVTIEPGPAGWTIGGVSDFTADGKPDILWRNTSTGAVAIWTMNGVIRTGYVDVATAPLEWEISGVFGVTRTSTAYALPDTGLSTVYSAGDDGSYSLHPLSYTDNGNGTVTDNVTGLLWQVSAQGLLAWDAAGRSCAGLTLGGRTGWRLPNRMELMTIADYSRLDPKIDTLYFPGNPGNYMWSSTAYAPTISQPWVLNFRDGNVYFPYKTTPYWSRCVRGAELAAPACTDNGDGTITDSTTGLMWQQQDDATPRSWPNALAYCEGLALGGHDDWRLPNVKELSSIVDDKRWSPAIDPLFIGANTGGYWSSTTYVDNILIWGTNYAYFVHFNIGNNMAGEIGHKPYGYKADMYSVRCVR